MKISTIGQKHQKSLKNEYEDVFLEGNEKMLKDFEDDQRKQ